MAAQRASPGVAAIPMRQIRRTIDSGPTPSVRLEDQGHERLIQQRSPVPSTAGDGQAGARPRGPKRRWLAVGAVLVAMLAVGAASLAWLVGGDGDDGLRADQAPTTVAPSIAPTAEPSTQDPGATAPTADQPDAMGVLAPFLSAAAAMDEQLHAAAEAINGA